MLSSFYLFRFSDFSVTLRTIDRCHSHWRMATYIAELLSTFTFTFLAVSKKIILSSMSSPHVNNGYKTVLDSAFFDSGPWVTDSNR